MSIGLLIFGSWLLQGFGATLLGVALARGEMHSQLAFNTSRFGKLHVFQVNIVIVGLLVFVCGILLNAWLWPGW